MGPGQRARATRPRTAKIRLHLLGRLPTNNLHGFTGSGGRSQPLFVLVTKERPEGLLMDLCIRARPSDRDDGQLHRVRLAIFQSKLRLIVLPVRN